MAKKLVRSGDGMFVIIFVERITRFLFDKTSLISRILFFVNLRYDYDSVSSSASFTNKHRSKYRGTNSTSRSSRLTDVL